MNRAAIAYCLIAFFNALLTANVQPATHWDWLRYIASVLVAVVTAWKTYYSVPSSDSGEPIEVTAPKGKPLKVTETKPIKK